MITGKQIFIWVTGSTEWYEPAKKFAVAASAKRRYFIKAALGMDWDYVAESQWQLGWYLCGQWFFKIVCKYLVLHPPPAGGWSTSPLLRGGWVFASHHPSPEGQWPASPLSLGPGATVARQLSFRSRRLCFLPLLPEGRVLLLPLLPEAGVPSLSFRRAEYSSPTLLPEGPGSRVAHPRVARAQSLQPLWYGEATCTADL